MSEEIILRYRTDAAWAKVVLNNFDDFLIDHAAAEKKASGMAMSMALHYSDKERLVKEMVDLAIEEMQHFRECVRMIHERNLRLLPDEKDPYVNALRDITRNGKEERLLDRLILGSIIEARGCERFGLVAQALPQGELKDFYDAICRSESKHTGLFVELARCYFPDQEVDSRLDQLLDFEAKLVSDLPYRAALH